MAAVKILIVLSGKRFVYIWRLPFYKYLSTVLYSLIVKTDFTF